MNYLKQNSISDVFKATVFIVLHLLLFLIIGLGLGYLSLVSFDISGWAVYSQFFQVLLFVAAGVLHVVILNSRRQVFDYTSFKSGLLLSLLISVALVFELLILYFRTDVSKGPLAISSGLAFLLPFMINRSWRYYSSIPRVENKIWYSTDQQEWGDIISLNTITLTLKLRRKYFSINEQPFTRIAAKRVPLGKMFHQFLAEQNYNNAGNIEVVDEHGNQFGWKFHSTMLGGILKKSLDPDAPLIANQLRDNSIIHATRIRTQEL